MNSSGNMIAASVGRLLKPHDLMFEREAIDPSAVVPDEILVEMAQRRLPSAEFARHIRAAGDLAAAYEDLLHRRDDVLTYVLWLRR